MNRKDLNEKHYSKKQKIQSNLRKKAIQLTQQQLSAQELQQLTELNQQQERITGEIGQIIANKPKWNRENEHRGGLRYDKFDQEKYKNEERYKYNLLNFEEYKLDSKYALVNKEVLEQYKKNLFLAKDGYNTHPKEKLNNGFKNGKDFKKNSDFHL